MARNETYAQILVELGAISTFDPKRLSYSTLQSVASHIRLLKRNHIVLTQQNFQHNTNRIINSLVDSHNKPLSTMYKRQIAITIKRLFPASTINFNEYSTAGSQRKNQTRLATPAFFDSIRKIVDHSSLIVKETYNKQKIEDIGLYDASLAVLLTICTSLRINELLQLKLSHIPIILSDEPIMINSKGGSQTRNIAKNEILVSLFKTIQNQRHLVDSYVDNRIFDKVHEVQSGRLRNGFIIMSSADYMRKKLHELASSMQITHQPLGFNSFRKFIVTMLIDGGGHQVAQSMNNHQSINTTLDNYNVVGPQLAEKTFAKIIPSQINNDTTSSNTFQSSTTSGSSSNTFQSATTQQQSQQQYTQQQRLSTIPETPETTQATTMLLLPPPPVVQQTTYFNNNTNFENSNLSTRQQGFLRNTSGYYSPKSNDDTL